MSVTFQIPELETERLRLRAPQLSDFEAMCDFFASDRAKFVGVIRVLAAMGVLIYGGVGVFSMLRGGNFLDYDFLALYVILIWP